MQDYTNMNNTAFNASDQVTDKTETGAGTVHHFQGREVVSLSGVFQKTQEFVNTNKHNIFGNQTSVSELKEMRTQKRELKANVTQLTARNSMPIKRVVNRIKSFLTGTNTNYTPSKSKLEIAQNEYEIMRSTYRAGIESNPAALQAKNVKSMIKQSNIHLSNAGGEWQNIDAEFSKAFDGMAKNFELFGDLKSFCGPKTDSNRVNVDAFLDDVAQGLEQINSSKALKEHDIKWMHGTRSPALGVMLATDHTLHPTGQLLEHKIYPMSGELGKGITGEGVNRENLSGTPHSKLGVKTTMEYSADFVAVKSNVWNKLSAKRLETIYKVGLEIIKTNPTLEGDFGDGLKLDLLTTGIYLERAKVIDPEFAINSEPLRSLLDVKIKDFPVDGPEMFLDWMKDLRAKCDSPPFINPTDEIRRLVNDSFPIVLATTAIEGRAQEEGGFLDEFVIKGGVHLNQMAVAFTEKERVKELQDLFDHAGLEIEVMDFNALKASGIKAPDSLHPENKRGESELGTVQK